jgi:hypothetical protein
MAIAPYGMQDRLAYAGGTPRFNEFSGTTMPNAAPTMTAAPKPATTSLSSLATGLPSGATMPTPIGGMLKPMANYGGAYGASQGAAGGLAPLQGQDLSDLQHTVLTGQYNGALADRLGSSYNAYVNLYGPGGKLWGSTQGLYANQGANAIYGSNQGLPSNSGMPTGAGAGGGFTDVALPGSPTPQGAQGATPGNTTPVAAGADNTDWSKLDVSKFLDPSLAYRENEAANVIGNSAASRGNLMSGATQKEIADRVSGMAGDAYTQALQASMADRTFGRGVFTNDRDYGTALNEWNKNFGEGQRQFNNNFGEGQRRFNTGVDQSDQQFAYNAARDDRNFNYSSLSDLARMGQNATGSQADISSTLARLLSANTIASGQAGAQGTLGSNNAINNMISQLIGSYGQNSWMDRLFPQQPGP